MRNHRSQGIIIVFGGHLLETSLLVAFTVLVGAIAGIDAGFVDWSFAIPSVRPYVRLCAAVTGHRRHRFSLPLYR